MKTGSAAAAAVFFFFFLLLLRKRPLPYSSEYKGVLIDEVTKLITLYVFHFCLLHFFCDTWIYRFYLVTPSFTLLKIYSAALHSMRLKLVILQFLFVYISVFNIVFFHTLPLLKPNVFLLFLFMLCIAVFIMVIPDYSAAMVLLWFNWSPERPNNNIYCPWMDLSVLQSRNKISNINCILTLIDC